MTSLFIVQPTCTAPAGSKDSLVGIGGWGSLGQRESLAQHRVVPWDSSWRVLTPSEVRCELKHN